MFGIGGKGGSKSVPPRKPGKPAKTTPRPTTQKPKRGNKPGK